METIAATGIRVGELRFITVRSVCSGQAEIDNKGKHRIVMLPSKLTVKLRRYAKKHGIKAGSNFYHKNRQAGRSQQSLVGNEAAV